MTKEEYLDSVCKFCCGRRTCCVGTKHFHPCKTYTACVECWDESAKRQHELDIEKACEWLGDNLIAFVEYDHLNGINIDYGKLNKELRKAMEDEE